MMAAQPPNQMTHRSDVCGAVASMHASFVYLSH